MRKKSKQIASPAGQMIHRFSESCIRLRAVEAGFTIGNVIHLASGRVKCPRIWVLDIGYGAHNYISGSRPEFTKTFCVKEFVTSSH